MNGSNFEPSQNQMNMLARVIVNGLMYETTYFTIFEKNDD